MGDTSSLCLTNADYFHNFIVLIKGKIMRIERKIRGFTLIELLIVLGIMAVMGAGMYLIYGNVMTSQKTNAEVNNMNILKSGIENFYSTSPTGYGDNGTDITETIAKSSIPTASMVKKVSGTKTLINAFGNNYTIESVGGANFQISMEIPRAACDKVGKAAANLWAALSIDNNTIKAPGTTSYDVNDIIETCSNADETVELKMLANDNVPLM